jgi:SAM-dependent methyltransferase
MARSDGSDAGIYGEEFFDAQARGSYSSARHAVPYILQFVSPRSVIDVGCGVGAWAKAFLENGVQDVRGVDGTYVDRRKLLIPETSFQAVNLAEAREIGQSDLVCCLEVAEHLDEEASDRFVDLLVSTAPIILFSAAIPGQGGTHHVNEKWPTYWIEKFEARGYVARDWIRPVIWADGRIGEAYRQNMVLFFEKTQVPHISQPENQDFIWNRVHPELWLIRQRALEQSLARPRSIRSAAGLVAVGLSVIIERVAARLHLS